MKELNLKQYLLGLLPAAEQSELELRILSEDEMYQQLLVAEEELIEAYLQAELSSRERENFERIFLAHPDRQQKLQLTRGLIAHATQAAEAERVAARAANSSWWTHFGSVGWKLVGATAVALLAFGLVFRWLQSRPPSMDARLGVSSPAPSSALPSATPVVGPKTLSVALSSGQVMAIGSKLQELVLTPEIGQVQLQLWLTKDRWDRYRATLQPADLPARELTNDLPRQTKNGLSFVTVTLSVAELPVREFTLKLEGITAEGERMRADQYSFQVKRN